MLRAPHISIGCILLRLLVLVLLLALALVLAVADCFSNNLLLPDLDGSLVSLILKIWGHEVDTRASTYLGWKVHIPTQVEGARDSVLFVYPVTTA